MVDWLRNLMDNYTEGMYLPQIQVMDVIEILILTVFIYEILLWIKNTKAWMLLRGIIMLGAFILLAWIFQMHTILYLAAQSINVLAIAAVVVFQPELRRALEKLGEKNLLSSINPFDRSRENERFSDETADSIVNACFDMGNVCTGALIVVEQVIRLNEYEMTGIELDCKVSSQVLINIFEHNTPLHDGAVIVRGDRITSATCYLPLSDNMSISKDLGTRHRAALGMSEVCDALVIVVSEETGLVSYAMGGVLTRGVNREELREKLSQIQYRNSEPKKKFAIRKGWRRE
ncbi:diadenylate cyclase CdaA [Ruminococcus sp. CLA-AA-H200]|uniref:Diadenylate cyclase n=1 Tax=Ruminococcus turbiniformis TaxID=2881258 RepID=A0ABS8FVP5_9FIRM|nr:diadenylate cyclase CdaA [Ruminococcus turbiniformis]MCC2254121.1 diadenylate cyclase CdaA [Ruminococcus turbiniformis]